MNSKRKTYLFVGMMFLGIAMGLVFDNVAAGTLGGMGLGFIASFFVKDGDDSKNPPLDPPQNKE